MQKNQYKLMYELEDFHWWFTSKRKFIDSVLPKQKKVLRILDVGCGTGGTTKYLEKYGKVEGIEASKTAHPFLKKRHLTFTPASIHEFKMPKEKYDRIFILDVLYHQNITDDLGILKKLYGGLKKGGYLCITDCAVPALMSHHDKVMEARERYTKKELEQKIKKKRIQNSPLLIYLLFSFPAIRTFAAGR